MSNYEVYKEVLKQGVAQRPVIEKAVKEIVDKGVENVYLVGCGGSLAVMSPIKYVLEVNSELPVYEYNASEFVNVKPRKFGSKSLVITSSYTGTTKETVAAAQYAKEKGASVIAFVGKADSPLGKAADYAFANEATAGVTDSKLIMLYQIVFNLIRYVEGYKNYDEMMNALAAMPDNLVAIKEAADEKAKKFAEKYKDEKFFLTIGAGACWGEAYSYANCILEEMQWIYAHPVHAGEFFHGAFEIVTEDTPVLVLQGDDLSRPLLDRVRTFTSKYAPKAELIDTSIYGLPGVANHLRDYMSPLVLSAVLSKYSDHLSEIRNHPLSTRRYMFKVEY